MCINFFDRFAKKKLDEFVFMGNRLQVSYAPYFESVEDTKEKLEGRRKEVIARLNRMFYLNSCWIFGFAKYGMQHYGILTLSL